MKLTSFLVLASAAVAFALPGNTPDPGCCCCNVELGAIVCNPEIPSDQCICTLAKCPDDAPTITAALPKPTPPPSYPSEPEEKRQNDPPPPPPPGKEWCCCCNGQDYICAAQPIGSGCFCPAIACPEDAQTIYPPTRPGRPRKLTV